MNIFYNILDKYKNEKQRILNKKKFKEVLLQAVCDGKLTEEEIDNLDKNKKDLGLTEDDVADMRVEVFAVAYTVAKEDKQISKEEEKELKKIQNYLGLTDNQTQISKKEFARYRLLNEIQKGNLPAISVSNLRTQKGEIVHWVESAILSEEKVLRRRYEGGSQGVSFRIAKGITYRVGGHRGYSVSETGLVPVGFGELVITNKRIIFRGDGKVFAVKLEKIFDMQIFTNGMRFAENNRSKQRMIAFKEEGNHDIIGAILSQVVNNYG